MSDWHKLRHKTTGAEQIVANLDGVNMDKWEQVCRLSGEPHEDDICDDATGKLKKCPKKSAARERSVYWSQLTRQELGQLIEDLQARVTELEKAI